MTPTPGPEFTPTVRTSAEPVRPGARAEWRVVTYLCELCDWQHGPVRSAGEAVIAYIRHRRTHDDPTDAP